MNLLYFASSVDKENREQRDFLRNSQELKVWPHTLTGTWLTTNKDEGPSGKKAKNSFRDISLSLLTPEYVDVFDYICISNGIKRSELLKIMEILGSEDPRDFFENAKVLEAPTLPSL